MSAMAAGLEDLKYDWIAREELTRMVYADWLRLGS